MTYLMNDPLYVQIFILRSFHEMFRSFLIFKSELILRAASLSLLYSFLQPIPGIGGGETYVRTHSDVGRSDRYDFRNVRF